MKMQLGISVIYKRIEIMQLYIKMSRKMLRNKSQNNVTFVCRRTLKPGLSEKKIYPSEPKIS